MSEFACLFNYAFDDAVLSTVPADCEKPGWPVENLQTTIRRQAWKSSGTGNVVIRIQFADIQNAEGLGLVEFNFEPDTDVFIRAYSDAYSTLIFEESFQPIGPISGWLEGGWLDGGWLGYPSPEDLAEYPRITALHQFQNVAAQYWEVEFRNGDGVENEIYLGRLMLGPVWSPEVGPSLNYKIQWQEYSVSDRSLSGIDYVDQIPPRLEIDLTLERLQGTEVFGEFARMAKKVGTKLPIIMQLTDEDLRQKKLTTVYGKFTASPGVEKTETAYKSNLIILEDL